VVRPHVSYEHIQAIAQHWRTTVENVLHSVQDTVYSEFWRNNLYLVEVNRNPNKPMIYVSIRRLDRAPVHDWRHFQRIKNELVGAEYEGVELYPAESRLLDTANQYHLWVFKEPNLRFPFGFDERAVTSVSLGGGKQRPYPEDHSGAGAKPAE
jgi:hypothetical protein